jgi:hypothetical protein
MKTAVSRVCFAFCFVVLAAVSTSAQKETPMQTEVSFSDTKDAEACRAKLSFSETLWDFGYVPKTGRVVHTYQIKNVGEDTLIIAKVRTTCGCTSAPLTKQRLAPDETADLDVVFNPGKVKVGQTRKKVQVISNDPNNPFAEIQFTAKIGQSNSLAKITPASISFDTVTQGTESVRTLTIENISGEKLSMTRAEGPAEGIHLDFEEKALEPGETVQATLRWNGGPASGNLHTSLAVDFECSKIARVSIPIKAVIVEK